MKEKPILFSAPMVRAILEGRKTQTRRIMKSQPYTLRTEGFGYPTKAGGFVSLQSEHMFNECPYGIPGDRLWVKEAYWAGGKWVPNGTTKGGRKAWRFVQVGTSIRYMDGNKPTATAKRDGECGWVGRFMPKAHSRLTLDITEIRVQRLQDISEEDAISEGVRMPDGIPQPPEWWSYRQEFGHLWKSINGEASWGANPFVWCVSFRRLP